MLSPGRNRSQLAAITMTASSILLLTAPAVAMPVEMHPSLSQARSPYEMILCGRSASFELAMTRKTLTMIEVPGGHEGHAFHKDEGFDFKEEGNHKVYIAPTGKASLGATTSIRFWLPNGREATIHARVVADLPVEDNVLLYHQSEREKLGLADKPNPCDSDQAMDRLIARATERHAHEPIRQAIPVVEHVARSGHALDVSMLVAEWEGHDMVVDFLAHNPDFQPSRLTGIEVFDEHGSRLDARLLAPHADRVATSEKATELAIVNGHGSMTGSILLSGILSRDVGQMELRFRGFKGASPYFTSVKVARFRLITEEEEEREARDKERRARAKQMAVSVRGIYGGFWTDAGDDLGGLDGTTVAGVGIRFTKGLTSLFAFEGEFVGGRTGDAAFAGVSWGGMQGDVTPRASLGRLQAAGVIRFGDRYITSTRLGVGVQLSNYDSTMDVGGTLMDGPGDGIEVDGLWSVGAGFDARLGEHWLLGVAGTFADAFNTSARSLEAGFHLGYGWGGSIED